MNTERNGKRAAGFALIGFGSLFLVIAFTLSIGFLIVIGIMNNVSEAEQENLAELMEHGVETVGTVTYAEDDRTDISYYDEEGNYYQVSYNSYYSKYGKGAEIAVYYDKENPNICQVPGLTIEVAQMLAGIFKIVGGIVIGGLLLLGIPLIIGGVVLNKKSNRSYDL
ncbi:MAG: DUF3592 domain-containing protein [Lachnospiraceae bacterium]|nr:DUF3592 domain-containing protein [Lachnospiraceae bacterium]